MTSASPRVVGIVPAAGQSSRMSSPKPLLETGDGTFLDRVIRSLLGGGAEAVLVVVSESQGPIAARARHQGAHLVTTRFPPEDGPVGSIRSALRHLREVDSFPQAVLLLPVDMPLIQAGTVGEVVEYWTATPTIPMVRPAFQGKSGHPVLFSGPALHLLAGDEVLPQGARSVVDRFREDGHLVPVDDAGILVDIDTLPEYRRHFPGPSRRRFRSR
ncbi:MAG: nucleotidyltransferase family protein [Gemmatimonadota bacterium]